MTLPARFFLMTSQVNLRVARVGQPDMSHVFRSMVALPQDSCKTSQAALQAATQATKLLRLGRGVRLYVVLQCQTQNGFEKGPS